MRLPFDCVLFEVEAWFIPDGKEKLDFVAMMQSITEQQRQEIIRLKCKRKDNNLNKKNLSSFDIYKQVLGF